MPTILHYRTRLRACVKQLAEAGANLDHRNQSGGLTKLHLAAGYVRPSVAKVLLDLSIDPKVANNRERMTLDLARDILKVMPKRNLMQFGCRIRLKGVIRVLEEVEFEYAKVQEILEWRGKAENLEYLVGGKTTKQTSG